MPCFFSDLKSESDIFRDGHMRKKGVFLENGIQLSFVWRKGSDILAVKDDPALIGGLKAADEAQRRGLSAAAASQDHRDLFRIQICGKLS